MEKVGEEMHYADYISWSEDIIVKWAIDGFWGNILTKIVSLTVITDTLSTWDNVLQSTLAADDFSKVRH